MSVGISILTIILTLTVSRSAIEDAARESLRRSNGSFTESDVDAAVTFSIVFTVIVGLIFMGLFLLFAYKMRAGRNWARITLTVLGALGIISSLANLRLAGGLELVISLIQAAVILGAIVFMYRSDSNQYYNASARAR
ncbi:hypothetical protein [Actinophytocola sp.]|uniref:hypothetical protein n=1 Tax=Actinophytocola sp. TaxID=1872138 RepID=UPI002D7E54CA|nr:hypothetical protein [Actinophytocola sp.]HET9138686.1 hypothetical protein [Actinophytocola sp.]